MCLWVDQTVLNRLQSELKERRRVNGLSYNVPQDEIIQLVSAYAHEQETKTEKNIGMLVEQIQKAIPTLDVTGLGP